MDILDKFFIINLIVCLLSFISNVIYYYKRNKNIKRTKMLDKHIESLDFKEKEDNFLRIEPSDGDDFFNNSIIYIILSFIPVLNLALIYMNIHNIFFLGKGSNEKDN